MELKQITFPEIGYPAEARPELPARVFEERLARVRERMAERGLDGLVVYGDREHFANIHWLTHYDPRFEETLLVVLPAGRPSLFVGNEGMGYSKIARLEVERVLYQPFSLLGQPRDRVKPLAELLREAGLVDCGRVGAVGWKYFDAREFEDGLVMAGLELRRELATRYHDMWQRIEARRQFMTDELGLRISEDMLPFSNFQAAMVPYLLAPERCMAR